MATQSVRVPNFLPSMSALHFSNQWKQGTPDVTINFPFVGNIALGDASNGLCGGFVYTVLDFFLHNPRILMLPDRTPPASGTSLFNYLVQRLIDSFNLQLLLASDGAKNIVWMMLPTHDTQTSWLTSVHGLAFRMVNEEWPLIKADLDSGKPSPLDLVTSSLGECHQVLAWGYDLDDAGNLTLFVYDCNDPDDDNSTISLNIGQTYHTIPLSTPQITKNASGNPTYRGFFRSHYSPLNLAAVLSILSGSFPSSTASLQPLYPWWHAWETFGFPGNGTTLQSPASLLAESGITGNPPPIGNANATGPAVCSWGPSRLDVFVQDSITGVDHFWWDNGTMSWESFNQSLLSYPAATSWGNGRIDLFGVLNGLDYSLVHFWFDQGSWQGWESLGKPFGIWNGTPIPLDGSENSAVQFQMSAESGGWTFLSKPACCSWGPNHLDIFAVAIHPPDPFLPHAPLIVHLSWDNNQWSLWDAVDLPTLPILAGTGPAAASWGEGRIDLFVVGQDNFLHHAWFDTENQGTGAWSPSWENLGAPPDGVLIVNSPSVSAWSEGRLDVFACGTDQALWHIWFDGIWHPWESLGGVILSDPGSAAWNPGRLDVFAAAQDFGLWHLWFQ